MKYVLFFVCTLLLTACTTQPSQSAETETTTKTFIETTSCTLDSDCTTPPWFLIQSNCPFTSLCIEGQCVVVCPLVFPGNKNNTCAQNSDCDCTARGERSLDCVCNDGVCYSVEG